MLDAKQVKIQGLRFARSLQIALKSAIMFSAVHPSAERFIGQCFEHLNNVLKQSGQFTFGFVDNQILLNSILTYDSSFGSLEKEFLKRGVSAVTFKPGLTLYQFQRVISLLSGAPEVIERAGGLRAFLDQNEIEGVRFLPAATNQKKNEEGDTIIETDSEAFVMSKQFASEDAPKDFMDSIDSLLESACYDVSTRSAVMSGFAAMGAGDFSHGVPINMPDTPYGEPSQVEGGFGNGGYSPGAEQAGAGSGGFAGGPGGGFAGAPSGGFAGGSGPGGGYGGEGGEGKVIKERKFFAAGKPLSFIDLMENSVERSLIEEQGNPRKSCMALGKILADMGVDKILASFPEERREEIGGMPPEQIAGEFIEDTALQWAGNRFKSADDTPGKMVIDDEVVKVLARSLQATQNSARLAKKLTQFIKDYAIPPHIRDKIQDELRWTALGAPARFKHLMEIRHYSSVEFRRLMEFTKELVTLRQIEKAGELAIHYFDFLEDEKLELDIAELSRAPEVIRSIPLARVGFVPTVIERLTKVLAREDVSGLIHFQTANALSVLSQSISGFEDFEHVLGIGLALDRSQKRDSAKHRKCCVSGLSRLLPEIGIERVIELFLLQPDDATWAKTATNLLRYSAPASVEKVFARLIEEKDTRKRLALLRLTTQLRAEAVEVAVKHLEDDRWFVVRNMCSVLADLEDPQLATHIASALQHPDARVQEAAFKALIKSRASSGRGKVLAEALPKLAPNILDRALDELLYLKDSDAIPALEKFIVDEASKVSISRKAVQVLANVPGEQNLPALQNVFLLKTLNPATRRAALFAIANHYSPQSRKFLEDYETIHDPLAEDFLSSEVRTALEKSAPRPN